MNQDAEGLICRRVMISGRVQGVWFRAWTAGEATKRHLDGWVRNRSDGSVEAVFSGPEQVVLEMIEACHSGPPLARVDNVSQLSPEEDTVSLGQGFITRDTA